MRPPGFNQPNVQNNQNRYQGTNSNFHQNRGGNFNQNRQNNQNQVYQGAVYQTPTNQPPINQVVPYQPPTNSVLKTDFENYVKANDAVLKNVQNQGQNLQNQMANVTSLLTSLCDNFKNSASTSNSGTLPSQTVTNPRQQINAITTRSGFTKSSRSGKILITVAFQELDRTRACSDSRMLVLSFYPHSMYSRKFYFPTFTERKIVEELKDNEKKFSSDVSIDTIVMPIRITFDNPIDFNDHFSKPKDLKKDLTISFDSTIKSSILPPPLLDSDSPFTAKLSANVILNSLGNEDKEKMFLPGIESRLGLGDSKNKAASWSSPHAYNYLLSIIDVFVLRRGMSLSDFSMPWPDVGSLLKRTEVYNVA
ncbi:hypothetical protein Tco_1101626 [Tanacetum coccineum]